MLLKIAIFILKNKILFNFEKNRKIYEKKIIKRIWKL